MTYNAIGGTLNPAQLNSTILCFVVHYNPLYSAALLLLGLVLVDDAGFLNNL